jgi:general secretion pathway protein A
MKGLGVLVGDVGTGKTLLARRLLEALPEEEFEVSLLVVLHSDVSGEWLIRRIASQVGVDEIDCGKVELISRLYFRLNELSEEGKRVVILIDEAHMLRDTAVLEEVRGVLNLELSNSKLISIIMFGMPELDACLRSEPALRQRMAVRCELKNFSPEILVDYVRFRMFHAGCERQIFSPHALALLYEVSRGNPRLVNVICDNALFEGYVRKSELPLGPEIIASVADDLRLSELDAIDIVADRR